MSRGKDTCGDIDILITRPTSDGRTHRGTYLFLCIPTLDTHCDHSRLIATPDQRAACRWSYYRPPLYSRLLGRLGAKLSWAMSTGFDEQKEKDRTYNEKMKKVFSSLEGERAEQKAMEKEKMREKKRAGRK